MIASGILLAVKEYSDQLAGIPLVVRLRGTNQEIGQKMVCNFPMLDYEPGSWSFHSGLIMMWVGGW